MTDKINNSLTPAASQPRRPPVRLKLRRINANFAKPYPPDGESKVWWKRLKKALGTTSSDFVNASLLQLQAAAQLPSGEISETATNAALALIEGAAPQNEIEGALAVQMACTHAATMSVLARFRGGGGSERRVVALPRCRSWRARPLPSVAANIASCPGLLLGAKLVIPASASITDSVIARHDSCRLPGRVTSLETGPNGVATNGARQCRIIDGGVNSCSSAILKSGDLR